MGEIHEQFQPELTALFYNGESTNISSKVQQAIDDLTSSYYIEFIQDDLSKPGTPWDGKGRSLLNEGPEKEGIHRLYEALQCCMWSNMEKITPESQSKPKESIPPPQKDETPTHKITEPEQIPEYTHLPDHDELLDGEDLETDNLFALMNQIKNCKENNKNLSDEERR